MAGEFGSIEWSRKDPKTWELHNTEQAAPTLTDPIPQAGESDIQAQMFEEMQGVKWDQVKARIDKQEQRDWRKQINRFTRNWASDEKAGRPFDAAQGVQELIDSGAMRMEEDGAYTNVPVRSKKQRERIVEASDQWLDYQHAQGKTQFDPARGGWYDPTLADDEMKSHLEREQVMMDIMQKATQKAVP